MDTKDDGRRRFLKSSAVLGLAAGAVPVVQAHNNDDRLAVNAYGARSRFVTTERISDFHANCSFASDCNNLTPLQDLHGMITPSELHFNSSHGAYPPDINPDEFELTIHGLVERPMKFSLADLKRMPYITRIHHIECTGNEPQPKDVTVQETHGKTACSEWVGVPLSTVFNEVGVKNTATWFVAEGADRNLHSHSSPMQRVNECFLAYGQNGEPLRPHQGYPLRLMVPGYGGFSHVKWLRRIKLVDEPLIYPSDRFRSQLGPKSVITFPSGGQQLPGRGFYNISGLAWSGGGAIRSVEVSVDGGRTWKQARLHGPALPIAHTRFSLDWNWDGKEATFMSRCTDEKGQVQPTVTDVAREKGVSIEQALVGQAWKESGLWNLVFPWRVAAEGKVQHALWDLALWA